MMENKKELKKDQEFVVLGHMMERKWVKETDLMLDWRKVHWLVV